MTQEELQEYESLSDEGKNAYNMGMRYHPDWTHKQALTYATIVIIASGPINGGTDEPLIDDLKALWQTILKRAQEFMKVDFPRIYEQVKDYFTKAIDWVKNAITVTLNGIISLFC